MHKVFAVAALLLAAGPASAAPPARTAQTPGAAALHSDPAADDNVRLYIQLNGAGLTSTFDGAAPAPLEAPGVMFTRLAPGSHTWTVTLPDGTHATANLTLQVDGMIASKGRQWWCLAAGLRDGRLTPLQMTPAQCQTIAAAGPD